MTGKSVGPLAKWLFAICLLIVALLLGLAIFGHSAGPRPMPVADIAALPGNAQCSVLYPPAGAAVGPTVSCHYAASATARLDTIYATTHYMISDDNNSPLGPFLEAEVNYTGGAHAAFYYSDALFEVSKDKGNAACVKTSLSAVPANADLMTITQLQAVLGAMPDLSIADSVSRGGLFVMCK